MKKMNVEELEVKIAEEKAKISLLEGQYDKEENALKADKIANKMMRAEDRLNRLIDRQDVLLDKEAEDGERDNPKDKNVEEEEDVCLECGSDLVEVEDGLLFCSKCGEYYERE